MKKVAILEVFPARFEKAYIIGARKVLEDIYEISVEYIDMGGYHTWFAYIFNRQFIFLSIVQYLSDITRAIKDEIWEREEIRKDAERYLSE